MPTTLAAALVLPQVCMAAPDKAALAVDVHTGRVLHAEHATAQRYPASLTKLMTVYMVFDALQHRRIRWSTQIKISRAAASQPPTKLGLKPGSTIRVRDAVHALIVKSANDVATAVAEHFAGSEDAFAAMMTRKARALGMPRTTFRNASGLPDRQQLTTARDMIQLALRLYDDFPRYFHLFKLRRFVYNGRIYRTHNKLLRTLRGTDGMKTGYTRWSGFNIVTSVQHRKRHIMAVVFGGRTAGQRNRKMKRLVRQTLPKAAPGRSHLKQKPMLVARRQLPAPPKVPEPRLVERVVASTPSSHRAAPDTTLALRARLAERAMDRPRHAAAALPVTIARVRTMDVRSRAPQPQRAPVQRVSQPTPPAAIAAVHVGRPPSTLAQQAHALALRHRPTEAPQPALWSRDMPRSALGGQPDQRRYGVQVGAFFTVGDARAKLRDVRARIGGLVGHAQDETPTIRIGGRTVYRARLAELDSATATRACDALRRTAIECFVVRAR